MNAEGFWGSRKTHLWRWALGSCKQGPRRGCPGALPEPSARRAELPWVLAWGFEVSVGCALRGGGSEAASSARENLAWAFVQPWSQGLSEKAARHCTACKLQL